MGIVHSALRHLVCFRLDNLKQNKYYHPNMDSVLEKNIVLACNSRWQGIGIQSVRKTIEDLCSESWAGEAPKVALDIELADDGETILNVRPVSWEEWITLPVREGDFSIKVKNGEIRVPTVVVAQNYDKVPFKTPHLNSTAIFERDSYRCQYCGNKFNKKDLNLDHVLPQSQGGKTTWGNIVCSCRACNTFKANRTPKEAGMVLLRKPLAPKATPVTFSIKEARHGTWKPFLHR